jgi:hypothetical protein
LTPACKGYAKFIRAAGRDLTAQLFPCKWQVEKDGLPSPPDWTVTIIREEFRLLSTALDINLN